MGKKWPVEGLNDYGNCHVELFNLQLAIAMEVDRRAKLRYFL